MPLTYLPSPSWAVVYGEVPSATRWSELGLNDNSLATGAGIDDLAILTRHLAASAVTGAKIDNTNIITSQSGMTANAGAKTMAASELYTFPESLTITVTRNTKIFFIGSIGITAAGDTEFRVGLSDNGAQIYMYNGMAVATHGSRAIDRTGHAVLTLASGTHVLKLMVQSIGGAGMNISAGNAIMSIFAGV